MRETFEQEVARLKRQQRFWHRMVFVGIGITAVGVVCEVLAVFGVGAHTMITLRL